MFYLVYQITNNLNNKIYIGAHSTKDQNDSYMGSGTHIKRAVKKHGKENFSKTILSYHSSLEEMYDEEKRIVDLDFVSREDTYNMSPGERGNFEYINLNKLNNSENQHVKANERKRWLLANDPEFRERYSKSRSLVSAGHLNPSFGTCWIHNNVINKKIKKTDLNKYLDDGWTKGRKMSLYKPSIV